MALYSNKMWRHVTSIWPYEIIWTRTIHGVGSFLYEPVTSCRANGRRYLQPLTPGDILWSCSYMKAKCLTQPLRRSWGCELQVHGFTLHRVWNKLDYVIDCGLVISRAHIRFLWDVWETFECLLTNVDVISLLHLCFCTGLKVSSSFLAPLFMRFWLDVSTRFVDIWWLAQ
jgi:hypothetical protein